MSAPVQGVAAPRVAATTINAERFYVRIAAACLMVAVVGFAPTYWVPLVRGTLDVPAISHAHAAVFYSWTLLFLVQTWLAANRKLTRHREWGVAGVALATTMVFVGMVAEITSLKQSTADGFGDAVRAFTIVPVSGLVFFIALFVLALVKVGQLETHKRLMVVATVSLLHAAVGRWFVIFIAPVVIGGGPVSPPPVFVTILPGLLSDLLIVAAMVHDRKNAGSVVFLPRGVPHRYQNFSELPAQLMLVVTPGAGFEAFFGELSAATPPHGGVPPLDVLSRIDERYGLTTLGPPMVE